MGIIQLENWLYSLLHRAAERGCRKPLCFLKGSLVQDIIKEVYAFIVFLLCTVQKPIAVISLYCYCCMWWVLAYLFIHDSLPGLGTVQNTRGLLKLSADYFIPGK